ncbi:MAG: CerR family C-terminal domain-containing protein [Pseudomonadota bacterium]
MTYQEMTYQAPILGSKPVLPQTNTPHAAPAPVAPAAEPRPGMADETRDRLIKAGLEVFGAHGFAGATTRQICQLAQANVSAIPYYFGGKEGLYRAVVEHIADGITALIGDTATALETRLKSRPPTPAQARVMVRDVMIETGIGLIASKRSELWGRIVLREQLDPTFAFDILYERVLRRLHGLCAMLLALVESRDPEDTHVQLTAFSLIGQVLVFRTAREAVWRKLGWDTLDAHALDAIKAVLTTQLEAAIPPASPSRRA